MATRLPEDPPQMRAEPRRVEIVVSGPTVLKVALVALGVFVLIVANEVVLTILLSLVREIPEAASALISVIAGSVVGLTALIIGAPFPIVLALIVGLFDLIPQIGSLIAAVIVVSITLAGAGLGPAVILAVVILIYQQVENYMIQPVVYRQAIELSGFATIAVVMVGGALMGVIGAILAVPVAGSLKVIFRELTASRRERMQGLRSEASSP